MPSLGIHLDSIYSRCLDVFATLIYSPRCQNIFSYIQNWPCFWVHWKFEKICWLCWGKNEMQTAPFQWSSLYLIYLSKLPILKQVCGHLPYMNPEMMMQASIRPGWFFSIWLTSTFKYKIKKYYLENRASNKYLNIPCEISKKKCSGIEVVKTHSPASLFICLVCQFELKCTKTLKHNSQQNYVHCLKSISN